MPAEWRPHERTWMAWPTEGYTLGDDPDEAYQAWSQVANTIARYEPVTMVVDPAQTATAAARRWLDPAVTVVDNWGVASAPASATVLSDNPPLAAATVAGRAQYGSAVGFDGSASSSPDAQIVGWSWNFGDGTGGSGATVSHTYPQSTPGRSLFAWTVTVTDSYGRTDTISGTIKVTPA